MIIGVGSSSDSFLGLTFLGGAEERVSGVCVVEVDYEVRSGSSIVFLFARFARRWLEM